jgi:ATP-dependent DNA helicase DinG
MAIEQPLSLRDSTQAALAEDGALARGIAGYVPRAAQQRMAAAVADAIVERATLVAEAGTGTGTR